MLYRAHTKSESNVIHQLREKESEMEGIMEEKEKLLEYMMKEREREKSQLEEVKGGGATAMSCDHIYLSNCTCVIIRCPPNTSKYMDN